MRKTHRTAGARYYDRESATYDAFNEAGSAGINRLLASMLAKHRARTVLDLACGTGSQVFWLTRRGFSVVGCDISKAMLDIARAKARKARFPADLRRGDMRTVQAGRFDAAIAISNAVGHLTKADFSRTMGNVRRNLTEGGVFIFDIFNRTHLESGDNIAGLTIDRVRPNVRDIQHSVLERDGVLRSFTTSIRGASTVRTQQTLQTYSEPELARMLKKTGYEQVRHIDLERNRRRILTVARRA